MGQSPFSAGAQVGPTNVPIRTKFVLRTFLIVVSLAKIYLLIELQSWIWSVVQHGSDESVSALAPGLWLLVQQLKRCDCVTFLVFAGRVDKNSV